MKNGSYIKTPLEWNQDIFTAVVPPLERDLIPRKPVFNPTSSVMPSFGKHGLYRSMDCFLLRPERTIIR